MLIQRGDTRQYLGQGAHGFHGHGVPNSWMVYGRENAMKMDDDWGYPYFREKRCTVYMIDDDCLCVQQVSPKGDTKIHSSAVPRSSLMRKANVATAIRRSVGVHPING